MDEYTIVVEYDVEDLIKKVNEHIEEGWIIVGAVVCNTIDDSYMQTMTR